MSSLFICLLLIGEKVGAGRAYVAAPHAEVAAAFGVDAGIFLKAVVGEALSAALPALVNVIVSEIG
jgi:hypothetical protein